MRLLKTATLFLIILMTVSVASAHQHGHHYRHWYYDDEDQEDDNWNYEEDDTPYEEDTLTENDSDVSLVRLCRNNVCQVGGDNRILVLKNNPSAKNPTYKELVNFLRNDKTDEIPYTSRFVCSDFAVTLHDNAEKAGIKTGWVASHSCNHAWNIVKTTDRGIVYVDCTGQRGGAKNADKILDVEIGEPLTGRYLFRGGNFEMGGEVERLLVFW